MMDAKVLFVVGLCLFGTSSALLPTPRNVLPSSLQVKNYPGQCGTKDQATTKACLDSYFRTYGIDSSTGLPDYLEYSAKTIDIVKTYGVQGLDFYCDFEFTLESCMGDLMTSPCMNPEAFMQMYGLYVANAENYAINFLIEAYTCQNKELAKSYLPCMSNIAEEHAEGLIDCSLTMQNDIPNSSDVCVTLDHYVSCVEEYYVSHCDAGVRSYICNTQEIALNFGMNSACAAKFHMC